MQLFGLGALALLLPIAVWGYRLLGHRQLSRERLRVVLWLVGAVLAAAFASCLPRSAALAAAVGPRRRHRRRRAAAAGRAVARAAVGAHRFAAAIVLGVAALLAFAGAAGAIWRDAVDEEPYEDEDEAAERRRR